MYRQKAGGIDIARIEAEQCWESELHFIFS